MLKSPEVPLKESKTLVCTACPMGCSLQAEKNGDEVVVLGARCKRGQKYAQDEVTNPKRTVTTTIVVRNGAIRRLPVRTTQPFPLSRVLELVNSLSALEVQAPIARGQVIMNDCLGEGIDLIATRTVPSWK